MSKFSIDELGRHVATIGTAYMKAKDSTDENPAIEGQAVRDACHAILGMLGEGSEAQDETDAQLAGETARGDKGGASDSARNRQLRIAADAAVAKHRGGRALSGPHAGTTPRASRPFSGVSIASIFERKD